MPEASIGALTSSPIIHRHPANPVLGPKDLPYSASLVFNAGVCKYQGKYVMVFRNDYGWEEPSRRSFLGTNVGIATSDDGVKWTPAPTP